MVKITALRRLRFRLKLVKDKGKAKVTIQIWKKEKEKGRGMHDECLIIFVFHIIFLTLDMHFTLIPADFGAGHGLDGGHPLPFP